MSLTQVTGFDTVRQRGKGLAGARGLMITAPYPFDAPCQTQYVRIRVANGSPNLSTQNK